MKADKRIKTAAFFCAAVLGATGLLFLEKLTDVNKEQDPVKKTQVMEKDLYNGRGLLGEQMLSDNLLYESDGQVYYADRVFRRFEYQEEDSAYAVQQITRLREACPQLKGVYLMPVPGRVTLEAGYEEDRERYQEYLSQLKGKLPEGITLVDVFPEVEAHQDEYLYFRTADSWTARGAYYGSAELCRAIGIEPFPLEAYEEHMYNGFFGNPELLAAQEALMDKEQETGYKEEASGIDEDRVYYYCLPGGKNREEVEIIHDGQQIIEKQPVISQSRKGVGTFVEGGYSWALMEGDARCEEKKDASIMILCDEPGKILASYMRNYYKNVYVVNIQTYGELNSKIQELLKEYHITELAVVQRAADLGQEKYSRALNRF